MKCASIPRQRTRLCILPLTLPSPCAWRRGHSTSWCQDCTVALPCTCSRYLLKEGGSQEEAVW